MGITSSYDMGREGIEGKLPPSSRVAFLYAGLPGVVGSPGYLERNWTEPRCTLDC
jgi:hypothetical protein